VSKANRITTAVLSSLTIVAVVTAWRIPHVAAFAAALVLSAAALMLALLSSRREEPKPQEPEALPEIEETTDTLATLQQEVNRLRGALEKQTGAVSVLAGVLQLFGESRDILDRLAALIRTSGEESSLRVTEGVFSVAETSLQFNKEMNTLLSDMFTVDHSLDRDVDALLAVIARLAEVAARFRDLGEAYVGEMARLEKTVHDISDFTGQIGDLSDQTDILAINASVAAARAGVAGKAFGVIAGGIRELSTQSKSIAASIDQVVGGAADDIAGAFEVQRDRVRESVAVLNEATDQLQSVSGVLASQIKIVAMSLNESQSFAEGVQKTMGKVTVALQADDAKLQILDHMCGILRDLDRRVRVALAAAEVEIPIDQEALRKDAEDLACRHFSVAAEYEAIGRSPGVEGEDSAADLEGDVTLF
jgi:methyl-accepting chemotaxis protein